MGRPKKIEDNEQEVLQPKVSLEQFQKDVKSYANHDATAIYINRSRPAINRRQIGISKKYIARLRHPYPDDWQRYVKAVHGGGDYNLYFTDSNKVPAPQFKTSISIPLEECDPIIENPAELVRGDSYTEQLIARWRSEGKVIVKEDGTLMPGQPGAAGANDITNRLLDKLDAHDKGGNDAVVDVMAKGMDRLMGMGFEMMNPLKMIEAMEKLKGDNGGGNAQMQMFMMVMQQTMQQNTMLIGKLFEREREPAAAADPMRLMDRMFTMFDRMSERMEQGPKEPMWMQVLNKLAPAAAAIAGPYMMGKAIDNSGLVPDAQLPQQPAASAEHPAADPQQDANRQAIDHFAARMLRCMDRSLHGSCLAIAIETDQSKEQYYQWRSMGKAGLSHAIEHYAPERWKVIAQRTAEYDEFVDDFMTAFDEEPETANV